MSIVDDFLEIIEKIANKIILPEISEVMISPLLKKDKTVRKSNFGVIKLNDGTIGLVYLNLSNEFKDEFRNYNLTEYNGINSYDLAKEFKNSNLIKKTFGLGAINAICQYFFKKISFKLDYTTDPLGQLNLNQNDYVGMVGFFPPLVKIIQNLQIPLIIIEKKENLRRKTKNWEITLDPNKLEKCNKILITSTTVLNDTIDEILEKCRNAEIVSVVGPTAGFLPDPLFKRGVNIVGGTNIVNKTLFLDLYQKGEHWTPAVKKYCIKKDQYNGINSLLENI